MARKKQPYSPKANQGKTTVASRRSYGDKDKGPDYIAAGSTQGLGPTGNYGGGGGGGVDAAPVSTLAGIPQTPLLAELMKKGLIKEGMPPEQALAILQLGQMRGGVAIDIDELIKQIKADYENYTGDILTAGQDWMEDLMGTAYNPNDPNARMFADDPIFSTYAGGMTQMDETADQNLATDLAWFRKAQEADQAYYDQMMAGIATGTIPMAAATGGGGGGGSRHGGGGGYGGGGGNGGEGTLGFGDTKTEVKSSEGLDEETTNVSKEFSPEMWRTLQGLAQTPEELDKINALIASSSQDPRGVQQALQDEIDQNALNISTYEDTAANNAMWKGNVPALWGNEVDEYLTRTGQRIDTAPSTVNVTGEGEDARLAGQTWDENFNVLSPMENLTPEQQDAYASAMINRTPEQQESDARVEQIIRQFWDPTGGRPLQNADQLQQLAKNQLAAKNAYGTQGASLAHIQDLLNPSGSATAVPDISGLVDAIGTATGNASVPADVQTNNAPGPAPGLNAEEMEILQNGIDNGYSQEWVDQFIESHTTGTAPTTGTSSASNAPIQANIPMYIPGGISGSPTGLGGPQLPQTSEEQTAAIIQATGGNAPTPTLGSGWKTNWRNNWRNIQPISQQNAPGPAPGLNAEEQQILQEGIDNGYSPEWQREFIQSHTTGTAPTGAADNFFSNIVDILGQQGTGPTSQNLNPTPEEQQAILAQTASGTNAQGLTPEEATAALSSQATGVDRDAAIAQLDPGAREILENGIDNGFTDEWVDDFLQSHVPEYTPSTGGGSLGSGQGIRATGGLANILQQIAQNRVTGGGKQPMPPAPDLSGIADIIGNVAGRAVDPYNIAAAYNAGTGIKQAAPVSEKGAGPPGPWNPMANPSENLWGALQGWSGDEFQQAVNETGLTSQADRDLWAANHVDSGAYYQDQPQGTTEEEYNQARDWDSRLKEIFDVVMTEFNPNYAMQNTQNTQTNRTHASMDLNQTAKTWGDLAASAGAVGVPRLATDPSQIDIIPNDAITTLSTPVPQGQDDYSTEVQLGLDYNAPRLATNVAPTAPDSLNLINAAIARLAQPKTLVNAPVAAAPSSYKGKSSYTPTSSVTKTFNYNKGTKKKRNK